jgi:hypothetical protein
MSDTPKLDTPRLRVYMQDGTEHLVETENPDMVLFDLERAKRKWPTMQEAPFLWINYLAYSRLKRSGVPVGASFDAWLLTTRLIQNVDGDGEVSDEALAAFPTLPGPEPD